MKRIKLFPLTLVLFLFAMTVSCEQQPKEAPAPPESPAAPEAPAPHETTATSEITEPYTVDEALNPLNVYRDKTKVFADTLGIQMYELILNPGDSIGLHRHLDHAVYIFEGGTLTLWVNGTEKKEKSFKTGSGFLGGPLTDSAKNTGDTRFRALLVEIFRPRME